MSGVLSSLEVKEEVSKSYCYKIDSISLIAKHSHKPHKKVFDEVIIARNSTFSTEQLNNVEFDHGSYSNFVWCQSPTIGSISLNFMARVKVRQLTVSEKTTPF